jgi:hypothetical protein
MMARNGNMQMAPIRPVKVMAGVAPPAGARDGVGYNTFSPGSRKLPRIRAFRPAGAARSRE